MAHIFSGHSACHSVFVSTSGEAYVLGRNEHGQCGLPLTASHAAGSSAAASGKAIHVPIKLDRNHHFNPPRPAGPDGDIVDVACGRHHTLMCTRGGDVYGAGMNSAGQVCISEVSAESAERLRPTRIDAF